MALIRCSECKGKVSDKAWMCPHCGFTLQKNQGDKSGTGHEEIRDPSRLPPTQDEKRAYKRIQLRMMAKINQETARIYDISKSGMKLATPLPHPDPHIDITLTHGEKIFHIKGIIRWVSGKRSFSNLIDMGVEISAAPPEYYQFIDELLANS
jgi:hypothetical protein